MAEADEMLWMVRGRDRQGELLVRREAWQVGAGRGSPTLSLATTYLALWGARLRLPRRVFSGKVSYRGAIVRGTSVRRPAGRPARGSDRTLCRTKRRRT